MSEDTTQNHWYSDLTAQAVKACKAKAESITAHADNAQRQFVLAAIDAESVYRHYLKSDEPRLVAYFEDQVRGIKASMAMVYVRAGRTYRLRDTLGLTKAQADAMSVHALSTFAPYAASADEAKVDEGLAIIKRDAELTEAAKAEGKTRKPLTKEGIFEAKGQLKAEAGGTEPVDKVSRMRGNIEGKLRDEFVPLFDKAEALRNDAKAGGAPAAYVMVAKQFAAWGAQYGALTPEAIDTLDAAWLVQRVAEAKAAKAKATKAETEAAKQADVQANAQLLAGKPAESVKPEATVKPVQAKRGNREANPARATRKPRAKQ